MTKLDEAVEAASDAYDKEGYGGSHERAMALAIQAALEILVPKARPDYPHDEWKNIHDTGYNNCRAETLKNAGVE